ncbi:hypothetical protein HPP92_010498 [Vanilla planifolia]|uniref:phosphatidyl-N-methylethanolamine N-methyltransferase n=1 Tax=Vanilla planifolia TaxID=51239 RepID=A0A835R592_VANPL|nr:hypothetical protein HPP92_010498 [Vanilla planifolia]
MVAAAAVVFCTLLPFPFYYFLWNCPQTWVDLCGRGVDPSHRMAQISHVLRLVQYVSLLSVARFSWPPWYCFILFGVGLYLNFKVYQLLGEAGMFYGVRFGKKISWVTQFPFGYIKDPQYVGSVLNLLACIWFVPYHYVLLWIASYLILAHVESKEDATTRANPIS